MIKHICFDFDGVILDSMDMHIETMQEAFGLSFTREEYREFLNGNFLDSPIGTLDWEIYNKALKPKYAREKFKPEIIEDLHSLSERYRLSINSSGNRGMIMLICKQNQIDHLFTTILGAEPESRKTLKLLSLLKTHALEKSEMLFVTDTLGDLKEAQEVGVTAIAITGGYHERSRLEKGSSHAIVDSWSELVKAIDGFKAK